MGCNLSIFDIGPWRAFTVNGHKVEIACAVTKIMKTKGVVYKLDGEFQGFTGSETAALDHATETITERGEQEEIVYRRVKAMADALLRTSEATTSEAYSAAMNTADQYRPALTKQEQARARQMARDMSKRT